MTIPFAEAWAIDFEFAIKPGDHPRVACLVTREFLTGRELRYGRDELLRMRRPPFDIGHRSVIVAFYASAELSCFLELGWPLPANVIDLFAEHRYATNGLPGPKHERRKGVVSGKAEKSSGRDSLLAALAIRNLAHMDVDQKERMRNLVLTEANPSPAQMAEILAYCASDVRGAEALLRYMLDCNQIDWPRALWRGRYCIAAARKERVGIPMDVPLHRQLSAAWPELRHALIVDVNRTFHVFDGDDVFKTDKFAAYIARRNFPWPRLPSGALALDADTFDEMARFHPELRPLYEVRSSLGEMRLTGLAIGPDGRNRTLLGVFQTVTGRNAPSASRFAFGPARWMRGLIKPEPGYGLAYVDWRSQEICVAACLSGDELMLRAYQSGDPYMQFARDARLVPADATVETHPDIREVCKTIVLGIGYGMGEDSMALRAGITRTEARSLIGMHRHTYRRFWRWAEDTIATALFTGQMTTKFGWRRWVTSNPNTRSLQNWPIQSTAAEMMRAAAIAATEVGLRVCCPVHDAFLVEAPVERLRDDVRAMQAIMAAAGTAIVGVPVDTDVKLVLPPDRYSDKRGVEMFNKVMGLLQTLQHKAVAA